MALLYATSLAFAAQESTASDPSPARELIEAGIGQASRGAYTRAASSFERAASEAQSAGRSDLAASAQLMLGEVSLARGLRDDARAALERALAQARLASEVAVEARALSALAELDRIEGDTASARERLAEASQRAEQTGDLALRVRTRANAARAELQMGGIDAAEREIAATEALLASRPDGSGLALDRVHLADTLARLSRLSDDPANADASANADADADTDAASLRLRSFVLYRDVTQRTADTQSPSAVASAHLGMGGLYEDEARFEEATRSVERAALVAQSIGADALLQKIEQRLGRLALARGDLVAARAAFERSLDLLATIRPRTLAGYDDETPSFREGRGGAYYALVDVLLRYDPKTTPVEQQRARMSRAREVVEALKADELRDYFGDACVELASDSLRAVDDPSLSRALIVYPIVLVDRIEILVSRRDRIERYSIPATRSEVEQVVRTFRRQLEDAPARAYLRSARKLYDWLVRPYAASLDASVDTIVFVPDDPLRSIPMAALHDGERFLIERIATAIAPGLFLTDPRRIDLPALEVLAAGLSDGVQGFPALPHVPQELAAVEERLGARVLLDAAFTADAWQQAIGSQAWGVLHVATHAEFRERSEESFLLTHDGRLEMNRFEEAIRSFELRAQPLELLTLSACETAAGSDRAALGLSGVAVQSGARSVLGSLWTVNDVATSRLMDAFYDRLGRPGTSRAEALRAAQRELLSDEVLRHPAYWSPFVLINNWM